MPALKLRFNDLALVGDGGKAILLRNAGDENFPNLVVVWTRSAEEGEASEDRPGRVFKRANSNYRSGVETVDRSRLTNERFVKATALAVKEAMQDNSSRLAIVAPPHALALLREELHKSVPSRIAAELTLDLVKHPVSDIERHLFAG